MKTIKMDLKRFGKELFMYVCVYIYIYMLIHLLWKTAIKTLKWSPKNYIWL